MSDERPWKLQLVCCGRDDGVVTCETRADAELTRSAYISAEGHDRQAILTGPPGAVETDPVALLGEYLGALGKGDWSETVCADMRALLEQVRTARNAATARAEQAEAALAELRGRLGEPHDEWVVRFTDGFGGQQERKRPNELYARKTLNWAQAFDPTAKMLHRVAGQWRDADATPRTALERAANEQGVPLVCDIDKLTAPEDERISDEEWTAYAEALGIEHGDEQGDGEGGGDE